jgi:hypothetical protein
MTDEERWEEEQGPRRPRVVDRRISARAASGETSPPPPPVETPAPEPPPPQPGPSSPQETEASTAEAPASEVWTPEQEAEARRMAEEIAQTPSIDWVVNTAVTLANVAGTKLQIGDPEDARLAIDALAAVLEAAGPRLLDAEAPLKQTLAQLQMMYAQAVAPPPNPRG